MLNTNSGFIKIILLIVILLLVLSYFGFDLSTLNKNEAVMSHYTYVKNLVKPTWDRYLSKPFFFVWNNIVMDLVWTPLLKNIKNLKEGKSLEFDSTAPNII